MFGSIHLSVGVCCHYRDACRILLEPTLNRYREPKRRERRGQLPPPNEMIKGH